VWTLEITDTGVGELKKVTKTPTGADNPVWSPSGNWIAYTSEVYPDCADEECNSARDAEADASKVKAKIADHLLYRHWTAWEDGKRSHVFIVPSAGGDERDMTPGDFDSPPFSLGGPTEYAFSPDSKELAFSRNTDKDAALSTNGDIFLVPVAGGEVRRITGNNKANDLTPRYSPDGKSIYYRAMERPGFEADRWQLMVYDRESGRTRSITSSMDLSIESFIFSPDGKMIYFGAGERSRHPIYVMPANGGSVKKIIADGANDDAQLTPDGKTIIFTRNSITSPIEIFRANSDGSNVTAITTTNNAALAKFKLKAPEDIEWKGAGGDKIHGLIVKPANFTPSKKWPLLVLIHGGPQGAWNDAWSYRWNPAVFASAGYVVFMPNPRGSTGYGQKFTDDISGDWGGKVFTDLMNGVGEVAGMPFIDKERIGAAGASYGGYMINWILGHNDDSRARFKVLVSHAGLFNLMSMYGATEELWFTEWEFKGTPWSNPEQYTKWSPHMFVKNFKTPTLVIHGELDYRVPYTEGLQLFTALQRQGVDSRLLVYPDEGHWILKPQNSELWYDTVLAWLDKYLKPGN
jgi:dipeptidyl aminopeptidase/acylaminoacyl peptidase